MITHALNPNICKQRQADFCELKATLVYRFEFQDS